MLQPVRATMPDRLSEAPAVVVLQLHQQPVHHLAGGLAGLPPRKAPRHLPEQVLQQDARPGIRYRSSRGCRFLFVTIHHEPRQPLLIACPSTCANNLKVSNYSCRISGYSYS